MKFILCTGDSHTCGQGAEGFEPYDVTLGYNGNGKGFHKGMSFGGKGYVNLVRDFVTENTASKVEEADISSFGQDVMGNRKITDSAELECRCDMLLFTVAEKKEYSVMSIYLDGELARKIVLHADITRYGEYSYRRFAVDCKGKKKVKLVCEYGEAYIHRIECWQGEYAVVNCGVGACDSGRYFNEYIVDLIEEFSPYMFIGEAHTINDWLKKKNAEEYANDLKKLIEIMKASSQKMIMTTVSPIMGGRWEGTVAEYEDLVKASYEVIEQTGVILADGHKAIAQRCEGLSEDEMKELLFADKWHVKTLGHQLYAEVITEKLKDILL